MAYQPRIQKLTYIGADPVDVYSSKLNTQNKYTKVPELLDLRPFLQLKGDYNMLDSTITLFSSDSRPQYVKDVFNVLALPHGSMYRFRYKEKYIHSDVIEHLGSSKIKGTIALIAFRTKLGIDKNEQILIPVRWASITNIRKSSDYYLIDFTVLGYAVFNKEFENCRNYEDINSLAKKYFSSQDKIDAFVIKNTPNIVIPFANTKPNKINEDDEKDRWLKVTERLSIYPKFEKCYYFKASIIKNGLAKLFNPNSVMEGGRTNINIEYNNFCDISDSEINVEYDECLLIPSRDKKTKIECRYDSTIYAFQAKGILSDTPTQITLNCYSYKDTENNQDIKTMIKIPLIIKRNRCYLFARVLLSLVGAIGIGLPGVLSESTPSKCKVVLFVIGSIFIAISWLIPYKE